MYITLKFNEFGVLISICQNQITIIMCMLDQKWPQILSKLKHKNLAIRQSLPTPQLPVVWYWYCLLISLVFVTVGCKR